MQAHHECPRYRMKPPRMQPCQVCVITSCMDDLKRGLTAPVIFMLTGTMAMSSPCPMAWYWRVHVVSSPNPCNLMFCDNYTLPIKVLRNVSLEQRGQYSGQTSIETSRNWLRFAHPGSITRSWMSRNPDCLMMCRGSRGIPKALAYSFGTMPTTW